MVSTTVVLELEWVMRGYDGFSQTEVACAMRHMLGLTHLTVEDREAGTPELGPACKLSVIEGRHAGARLVWPGGAEAEDPLAQRHHPPGDVAISVHAAPGSADRSATRAFNATIRE